MAEVGNSDQNIVVCTCIIFGENCHSRSGLVFTSRVRTEHGDRCWKASLAGNKGESPEFECGAVKY